MDDIYAQEWYRGKVSRKDAEKILLYAGNPIGTFLIRESENSPGGFSLSIRDYSEDKGDNVKVTGILCILRILGLLLSHGYCFWDPSWV